MQDYIVEFEGGRVGRRRGLDRVIVRVEDGEELAEVIWRFARGHLGSRNYEVRVNMATGSGSIEFGRFARFTFRPAEGRAGAIQSTVIL